jgi:hypothetical protein
MAWAKGQSGNPLGGSKNEKPWRDALRRALARKAGKGKGVDQSLELVADKVVELALSGDIQCIKEIGDRIDGKAHQSSTVTVKDVRTATDAELLAIIAEEDSRAGAVEPQQDTGKPH